MGESLGRITSLLERRFGLYDGNWVKVERWDKSKKERPKSQAMQNAHPELYDFLMRKEGAKELAIGILHIDHNGKLSKQLAEEGKTPVEIGRILLEELRAGLTDIAKKIKNEPAGELSKINFLTAFTRLAWAKRVAQQLGFEVFDMDDEEVKFASSSHGYTAETYKTASPNVKIKRKEAKIVLISREKLLGLYGSDTDNS